MTATTRQIPAACRADGQWRAFGSHSELLAVAEVYATDDAVEWVSRREE